MKMPRRSTRWWEYDELVTLVDAVRITGLDEDALEASVAEGRVAAIEHAGIRYYRKRDLQLLVSGGEPTVG